jgi:putative transposase
VEARDHAMIESFWATVKEEGIGETIFSTRHEAKIAVFEDIEVYDHRKRRHASLGYLSPVHYEKQGEHQESSIS